VGWHTFRHSVGAMLAEMGERRLTIRDYLRHSNLHVTNKYLNCKRSTNFDRLEQLQSTPLFDEHRLSGSADELISPL